MLAIMGLAWSISAQKLKPYTVGAISTDNIQTVKSSVVDALTKKGFEVIGSYNPVADPQRMVIAFTSADIKSAVEKVGGITGFASAWRVALTGEEGKVIISYNTPEYWGLAYFRSDYDKVKTIYTTFSSNIKDALASVGTGGGEQFGSEDGLEPGRLKNYRYKVLMPQFDDTQKLEKFDSYTDAITTIDKNLQNGVADIKLVYSVAIPGKNLKLYGIALMGEDGEGKFMPKIDISDQKHTAFLPYEFLVKDNEVHMLHGRYRIALSFPDLSMGTFMKIVSTPGDIKDLLNRATKTES